MSEAQTANPIPKAPADEEEVEGLNEVELKNQASRCPCRGSNDMCVCQNVPDAHTRDERGLPRAHHPDDEAVDRFAVAMKAKLAQKRAEGRGGWENKDECGQGYLSELLAEHVRKGDPVDVANLAMMLHQRGERINAIRALSVSPLTEEQPVAYLDQQGNVSVPEGSPLKALLEALPAPRPPLKGKPLLALFARSTTGGAK